MPVQFVNRRDTVGVYRVEAAEVTGGLRRTVLASFSRHDFLLRPAPGVTMTAEEGEEVEGYRVYLQLRDGIRQKLAAHEFEETVRDVLSYLATVEDATERDLLLRQLRAGVAQLRGALPPE